MILCHYRKLSYQHNIFYGVAGEDTIAGEMIRLHHICWCSLMLLGATAAMDKRSKIHFKLKAHFAGLFAKLTLPHLN